MQNNAKTSHTARLLFAMGKDAEKSASRATAPKKRKKGALHEKARHKKKPAVHLRAKVEGNRADCNHTTKTNLTPFMQKSRKTQKNLLYMAQGCILIARWQQTAQGFILSSGRDAPERGTKSQACNKIFLRAFLAVCMKSDYPPGKVLLRRLQAAFLLPGKRYHHG